MSQTSNNTAYILQCVFKCMHFCVALCDMHGTAKHCHRYMVNLIEKDLYLVDVFDHTVH